MATVLVVDDDSDLRELVRVNLSLEGHTVLLAADGDEALERVANDHPDLILLDVLMPRLDGWAVLNALKAGDRPPSEIPIVMLTARSEELDQARGAIEGAVRYITKPCLPADLIKAVDQALSGDPEPVKRRRAQTEALRLLARLQRGDRPVGSDASGSGHGAGATLAGPHLTRLEPHGGRTRRPDTAVPRLNARLSLKQRGLIEAVARTATVREAADVMGVSRSYVYASLRRIARKIGAGSSARVAELARQGAFGRAE